MLQNKLNHFNQIPFDNPIWRILNLALLLWLLKVTPIISLFSRLKDSDTHLDFRTKKGFSHLYERHARKLFTICFSRIQNREESEEIVHNLFQSIWERRNEIVNEDGSIERYLVRAAKLRTIDYFRRKTNKANLETSDLEDHYGAENRTEDHYLYNELKNKVESLVDQLPRTCRKVYQLSREKGLSNKEIASVLLISEKTVESHMTKALSHLRKNLTEYSAIWIALLLNA